MNLREQTYAYVDNGNVIAFRLMLRPGEGTDGPNGYRTLFGGGLFDGFDDHPRIIIERNGYRSSAAGAYQFLSRTWDECAKALGLKDFSPRSQDLAATFLIARRGALDDVLAGRIEDAIRKCAKEWASLPGSPYGQPVKSLAFCLQVYRDSGGQFAATPAPIEERPVPVPPPIPMENPRVDPISLVGILASVFAPLIRSKVEKAVGTEVGKPLADNLLGMAQELTGKADVMEAVAIARQDPAMVETLQQAADDWFAQMAPMLDKIAALEQASWAAEVVDRDAAGVRGRADAVDIAPGLVWLAGGLVGGVLLFLMVIMAIQSWFNANHAPGIEMLTLVGPLLGTVFGVLATVYAYRFGSSRQSGAKDLVIGEMARRQK